MAAYNMVRVFKVYGAGTIKYLRNIYADIILGENNWEMYADRTCSRVTQ